MTIDTTKETIINNALKLFSTNGYNNTSMKSIAKESGVNEVTVFRKFVSKENLFQEVIQQYMDQLDYTVDFSSLYDMTLEDGLRWLGKLYFNYCIDCIVFFRIQLLSIDGSVTMQKLPLTTYFSTILEHFLIKKNITINTPLITNLFFQPMLGFLTCNILINDDCQSKETSDLVDAHIDSCILYLKSKYVN